MRLLLTFFLMGSFFLISCETQKLEEEIAQLKEQIDKNLKKHEEHSKRMKTQTYSSWNTYSGYYLSESNINKERLTEIQDVFKDII